MLTETKAKAAKAKSKQYALGHTKNLSLRVQTNGAKYWIFRYLFATKPNNMSLGSYPEISVERAEELAVEARADLRKGQDPRIAREVRLANAVERSLTTFASVAAEWQERHTLKDGESNDKKWSARNAKRVAGVMRRCLIPELGQLPIDEITPPLVKAVLLKAQNERGPSQGREAQAAASAIFAHAIACGLTLNNPALPLKAALDPRGTPNHLAALPFEAVGPFLRELQQYDCAPTMRVAVRLVMMVAMRDTALRSAQWLDIDLEGAALFSPASKNKGRVAKRRDFESPLPKQAVELLRELEPLTCESPESFVFASYGKSGHLSHGAINGAVKAIAAKIGHTATCHGMRSMLRDWAAHNGYTREAGKSQLAQVTGDATDQAYLRTSFFEQRVAMLQHYADTIEAAEKNLEPVAPSNVRRLRVA